MIEGHTLRTTNTNDLYFLSGKRMYEIGSMSGDYPHIGSHIPGEMGGIWAYPIKVLDGFSFEIVEGNDTWQLNDCKEFSHFFAYAEFHFERNDLMIRRKEFVVEDQPALFSTLMIENLREERRDFKLRFISTFHIMPDWYSFLSDSDDRIEYVNGRFIAYDTKMRLKWGVAVGGNIMPGSYKIEDMKGILEYSFILFPKQTKKIDFLIIADPENGYRGALSKFNGLMGDVDKLFIEKVDYYDKRIHNGVRFDCSDAFFTKSFLYAKANLVMLTADISPYVGKFLLAGIPEYARLFGCDTAYSIPGLMAVNYTDIAEDSLNTLARVGMKQGGRIPHEVSTSGNVYNPGNVEETPLFVIACWNYFKWTGNKAFLDSMYPLCKKGIEYTLKTCDNDLYPKGNAMIERLEIGNKQVDSVSYLYNALLALSHMAEIERENEEAVDFKALANDIKRRFNEDWWMKEKSLFADSLGYDNTRRSDGYWTQVIPIITGIGDEDKGLKALKKIEDERINRWGLVHTKDVDNEVWTLPTGILAKAEFNYGNVEIATNLLKNIAVTTEYGMPGSFKELIPKGMCFMQLWSSAIFLQNIVEGIFGVEPIASEDAVNIFPKLPKGWEYADIKALRIGEHVVNISYRKHSKRETELIISHIEGEKPLRSIITLFTPSDDFQIKIDGNLISSYSLADIYGKKCARFTLFLKPHRTVKITVSRIR